jgi:hypothetical protein
MKSVLKSIFTLLVASQISNFAHANKGIILKDDTNLDYYENDKFVKQVNHFNDIYNEFISLYFTGDYYYVVKKYKNVEILK